MRNPSLTLTRPRLIARGFTFSILAALVLSAPPAAAEDQIGKPIWRGYLDGLDVRPGLDQSIILAPAGDAVVYRQGNPWPRWMYLRVSGKPQEPAMLGAVVPFGDRAAQFAASGTAVYFTALDRIRPYEARTPERLQPAVMRVETSSLKLTRLYPAQRSSTGKSAELLDVHPDGKVLLIGTHRGTTADTLEERTLAVAELTIGAPQTAALGFRLPADAPIRFSRDGRTILYAVAPGEDHVLGSAPLTIYRFHRDEKRHEAIAHDSFAWPIDGGRVELERIPTIHIGSFGIEPFVSSLVRPRLSETGAVASYDREFLSTISFAPILRSIQKSALVTAGFQDRPQVILAPVRASTSTTAPPFSPRRAFRPAIEGLTLADGFLGRNITAQMADQVRPLVEKLFRTLASRQAEDASRPAALVGTWRHEGLGVNAGVAYDVRVEEMFPGYLRLEKRPLEPAPQDDEKDKDKGEEEEPGPTEFEALGFDPEGSWWLRFDIVRPVPPDAIVSEVNVHSLYRQLLDPLGFWDPRLRFVERAEIPSATNDRIVQLSFTYPDGFTGYVLVAEGGSEAYPLEIITPLYFWTARLQREIGDVPKMKQVVFEDWTAWKGRKIPKKIRFENGYGSFRLTLKDFTARETTDAKRFRRPGLEKPR